MPTVDTLAASIQGQQVKRRKTCLKWAAIVSAVAVMLLLVIDVVLAWRATRLLVKPVNRMNRVMILRPQPLFTSAWNAGWTSPVRRCVVCES